MQVNVHEAKTNFSRLIERAMEGEEIIVARNGQPLVRLTPLKPLTGEKRIKGLSSGKGSVGDDFDSPLAADILGEFAE